MSDLEFGVFDPTPVIDADDPFVTAQDYEDHLGDAALAEAVAYRTGNELDRSVRYGIQRDDQRGDADGRMKIDGDLRQERVGDAHLRLAGKAGRREQRDGADESFALRLRRRSGG